MKNSVASIAKGRPFRKNFLSGPITDDTDMVGELLLCDVGFRQTDGAEIVHNDGCSSDHRRDSEGLNCETQAM